MFSSTTESERPVSSNDPFAVVNDVDPDDEVTGSSESAATASEVIDPFDEVAADEAPADAAAADEVVADEAPSVAVEHRVHAGLEPLDAAVRVDAAVQEPSIFPRRGRCAELALDVVAVVGVHDA